MDNFQLICEVIISVASLIPTLVSLFVLIRNIIKNKDWNSIFTIVKTAMTTVEEYSKEHSIMTSEDKLNMAIEIVKQNCKSNGIEFTDTTADKVKSLINELCSWSKTVNSK